MAYYALFGSSVLAMLWWRRRQRKMRLPFGEQMKLVRQPGEAQMILVRKFDEDGFVWMVLAALAPASIGMLLLLGTSKLPRELQSAGMVVTVIVFVAIFLMTTRWFARKTRETNDRYLGYFGERLVAEHLEPLKVQGWRIFHDVPCSANGNNFNIDHVAVGPPGVFSIETKTRRKGGARPGYDDHRVFFDGQRLVWPWGEDSHGLEQAERNAVWLANTLETEIGERVHVTPFLTLPGWWVENKPSRDSRLCRVVNSKALPAFLSSGPLGLDDRQIAEIATKLESRCRDIEF